MLPRLMTAVIKNERLQYRKMIFVAGPRQVGKTTLFRQLMESIPGSLLNWDDLRVRKLLKETPYAPFESNPAVFLDEIHKFPRWKNYLKGAFDTYGDSCLIHVTGSARMDVYRRGGDSLLGRYMNFRLHPLSLGELLRSAPPERLIDPLQEMVNSTSENAQKQEGQEAWDQLRCFGGFPEPLLAGSEKRLRIWRNGRHERLVREDIRDLSRIRELALLEQMISLLPDRAGQLFSLNSVRTELDVSYDSVRDWLEILEQFYYLYLVPPYSNKIARALRKERKLYLWDWSEITDDGARFENMVASHLLKWCHLMTDLGFGNLDLHYLRDKEKNEVDFLIARDKKPWFLVEAKRSDTNLSASLVRFSAQLGNIPGIQLVEAPQVLHRKVIGPMRFWVCSAARFFRYLP